MILTLCLIPPLVVVLASLAKIHVEWLRATAVACATVSLASSLALVALPASWPQLALAGGLVRIDALTSLLIPMTATLWLMTVAVTPRSRLDRVGLRRTAIATVLSMICFATTSPLLLALTWVASTGVYVSSLKGAQFAKARRVAQLYLGCASAAFVAGVALLSSRVAWGEPVGLGLVMVAALIRKGIFPFHAWLPEAFEGGRLGPAALFSAPQVGTYVTVVLIVPRASSEMLYASASLALITAVYGAALALSQRDARRACGYLFVSQSALVMAGLECESSVALTGSLVLWLSSAVAFTGIARCVLALEVRRGRLDLSKLHGGYEQMPLLAVSFLVLGLACTGFPGTLGFIGQELLVDGATAVRPILGFAVVVASALTGLCVLRMYFSLFCGRRSRLLSIAIRRRETIMFGAVAAFLIGAGIMPAPVVASRVQASEAVLAAREAGSTPGVH